MSKDLWRFNFGVTATSGRPMPDVQIAAAVVFALSAQAAVGLASEAYYGACAFCVAVCFLAVQLPVRVTVTDTGFEFRRFSGRRRAISSSHRWRWWGGAVPWSAISKAVILKHRLGRGGRERRYLQMHCFHGRYAVFETDPHFSHAVALCREHLGDRF